MQSEKSYMQSSYDLLNYDKCVIAKEAVSIITGIYAPNRMTQEISE